MDSDPRDSTWLAIERLQARLWETRVLRQMSEEARARARATRDQVRRCRAGQRTPADTAAARQQAGLATTPVIEQAKGILMARQECGPTEAFDLLRQASERAGSTVPVLAAQIVDQVASSGNGDNVVPIALSAMWHPRSETRVRPPAG